MVKKYEYKNNKSLRLSDSAVSSIKYISKLEKINESDLLRKFIDSSIERYKLELAFKVYENKSVSFSGAAEIAGISYKDFLEKMYENNIKVDFSSVGEDVDYFLKNSK
jgi:predicted HTH domain antitoxin